MKKYRLKGYDSTYEVADTSCPNSQYKASFMGGTCECGCCKISLLSHNNNMNYLVSEEEFKALEEVPQRVELMFNTSDKGVFVGLQNKKLLIKTDRTLFTDQEKALCEKALNNELFDIDSLDELDFYEWYCSSINCSIHPDDQNDSKIWGIKAVLKQYLEQRVGN